MPTAWHKQKPLKIQETPLRGTTVIDAAGPGFLRCSSNKMSVFAQNGGAKFIPVVDN